MLKNRLKQVFNLASFVAETTIWGLKETLDFKNNWRVPDHGRQHGLDDGRAEIFYILSGVVEALFTGQPLTALGRTISLFTDLFHSVNLVRHSGGKDLMKNGAPMEFDIPDYVAEKISGVTDVQALRFHFSKDGFAEKIREMWEDPYNRWLLTNRLLNFKMFPNGAGRTAEMTTGLGLTIVGLLIAHGNGGNSQTFDIVRGMLEASMGAGSLASGFIDILVREEKEREENADEKLLETKPANASPYQAGWLKRCFSAVAGDFIELKDHIAAVLEKIRSSDDPFYTTLRKDLQSAPTRYSGAIQLAAAQLLVPLAVYTALGGAVSAQTPAGKAGFVLAGASMATSWFFKHRSCMEKTRMSLRGVTVGAEQPEDPACAELTAG